MRHLIACILLLGSTTTFAAADLDYHLMDTRLDFAAPVVPDSGSLSNLPAGSIVFDASDGTFKGLDLTGNWADLSLSANPVVSAAGSSERVVRATINPNCTINSQSGTWLTSTSGSASDCTLNVDASIFGSTPACVCTPIVNTTTANIICIAQGVSSSTIDVIVKNTASSGGSTDSFGIVCMGPQP